MSEWIPVEKLIKNEQYDDANLGVSNHYGIYVKVEGEGIDG